MEKMSFGEALDAVKNGRLIAREGWNGKDMFVFMRPEDHLSSDFIIDKVKSLPQAFKDYLSLNDSANKDGLIKFTSYLCMKNAQGDVMNGWAATQTDMLANDWFILEY